VFGALFGELDYTFSLKKLEIQSTTESVAWKFEDSCLSEQQALGRIVALIFGCRRGAEPERRRQEHRVVWLDDLGILFLCAKRSALRTLTRRGCILVEERVPDLEEESLEDRLVYHRDGLRGKEKD
jgi:hypothetical protein